MNLHPIGALAAGLALALTVRVAVPRVTRALAVHREWVALVDREARDRELNWKLAEAAMSSPYSLAALRGAFYAVDAVFGDEERSLALIKAAAVIRSLGFAVELARREAPAGKRRHP